MSQRVSAHFKIDLIVGRDDKEKMYCVINHNDFPVVWFHSFNSEAKRMIGRHVELRRFKHKMPKPPSAKSLTEKERSRMCREAAEESADIFRLTNRIAVSV